MRVDGAIPCHRAGYGSNIDGIDGEKKRKKEGMKEKKEKGKGGGECKYRKMSAWKDLDQILRKPPILLCVCAVTPPFALKRLVYGNSGV